MLLQLIGAQSYTPINPPIEVARECQVSPSTLTKTGERLLDAKQSFFVLASNDYSRGEAVELVRGLLSQGAAEAKFKTLKKTPAGRARLTQPLVDPRFNASQVAAFVIDKRFMVFTKLVDTVMETLLYEARGADLYKRGANLVTANMMHYAVPAFCSGIPPGI